jgi:hypothetical protein
LGEYDNNYTREAAFVEIMNQSLSDLRRNEHRLLMSTAVIGETGDLALLDVVETDRTTK